MTRQLDELTESLLAEAEASLNKTANDPNGAPEQKPESAGAGQESDPVKAGMNFIAKVEQFKGSLSQQVAGAGQVDPGTQQPITDPNAAADPQAVVDPNAAAQPTGGITVQTPGGSIVKIAAIELILSLAGSDIAGDK